MITAASNRAIEASSPVVAIRAGNEIACGAASDQRTTAMRAGAISPVNVICAVIATVATTASERKFPLPSSTSEREGHAFAMTMP